MEQGTGKTRTAIELIESTDSTFVLFLCPFSTKHNLKQEIDKWGLSKEYMIVAYETISSSDVQYLDLLEVIESIQGNIFIVADESIFIKNEETKRFDRVMTLAKSSEYRLLLNGTPITNNEWDLYNQMDFLSPKIVGMDRIQFLQTFFTKVQYKKKFQRPREFYKLSKVNVHYLRKLIEPYVFRVSMNFDKQINTKYEMIPASNETIERFLNLKEELLDKISK
ncbi:SNF2-related protein, partial [Salmonella enterica]|uniref:SNF2-related protein n=1 Tax=Salmonella enterica TaxID=28901 RepID=UPI000CB9A03E